jgi:hypothetical protein
MKGKIGFLYQWHSANARGLELEFEYMRSQGFPIEGVPLSGILRYKYSVSDLDFRYCAGDPVVMSGLERLGQACKAFSVIVIYGTLQIPPDFIRKALSDKIVVYWATDDPVNSTIATLPYVHVANHVFSQSPRYLEGMSMPEWLLRMGARSARFSPLGYLHDWLRGQDPAQILDAKRDIPISFVGSPSWRKHMLLDAKRHFGSRLRIYSRDWSPWGHFAYDLIKGGVLHVVGNAKDESQVYFRSRISINSNACSGPSTSRTFHIPVCGAAQACDFPIGLADIFDVAQHVLPYEYIDSESLCSVIDNALTNEKALDEMRIEAFWYVLKNYRFGDIFRRSLEEVL